MTISLRPVLSGDEEFLFSAYASTRVEEMDLIDWNILQKQAFLQMQFRAQRQQYQYSYPDAIHQIIEFNGVSAGQWIVHRSADEICLVDIALLPEFRNLGLGSSLLRSLQAEGKKITRSEEHTSELQSR